MTDEQPASKVATDPWDELPFFREALEVAGMRKAPAPQALFHYTSADGLLGILRTGKLFASDSKFFNDTSEGEYGGKLLAPLLSRFDALGEPRVATMIGELLETRRAEPLYVVCFCESDDVLGQWRGYSSNGAGYAIGFPHAELSGNGLAPLLPVRYGDDEIRTAMGAVVDWGVGELRKLIARRPRPTEVEIGNLLTAVVSTLFLLVVTSKKAVFRHEHEWRLVYPQYAVPQFTAESLEFRAVEGLIVPYHEFVLPKRADGKFAISSVRCGPVRHESRRVDGIKTRLSGLGLGDIPVLESEAPLRR